MTDSFDDDLRRRFAAAPSPADDATFVVAVALGVARRRRWQWVPRLALMLGFSFAVVALAPGLSALAAMAGQGALILGAAAIAAGASLPGMLILGALGFAGCVLAWIARRT